jgi:hypothetical protein
MPFLKMINSKMPLLSSSGTTVPSFVYCTDVESESYIDWVDDSVHDDDEADYDETEKCENRRHLPEIVLHHIMTRPIVDDDREWSKEAAAATTTTTVEQHTSDAVTERSTVDHNDDGCATVSIYNSITETGDESSGRGSDAGPVKRRIQY